MVFYNVFVFFPIAAVTSLLAIRPVCTVHHRLNNNQHNHHFCHTMPQQSHRYHYSPIINSATRLHQSSSSSSDNLLTLPPDHQEIGNDLIREAARSVNPNLDEQEISIDWKQSGRIIITLNIGSSLISSSLEEEDDDDDDDDGLGSIDDDDDDDILVSSSSSADPATAGCGAVDITQLSRAINAALDDDARYGQAIAQHYDIEVTSPGASDEIQGDVMFQAYKGFDVIVNHQDAKSKKKKVKTIEGRLHSRDDEYTVINIKGRMKKLKNTNLLSVKLPKAKREKGAS